MSYAKNKDAGQPAHPRSLISVFVIRCWDNTIPVFAISKVSRLYLASVAEQTGLSLTWSKIPKTGFLVTWLKLWLSRNISQRVWTFQKNRYYWRLTKRLAENPIMIDNWDSWMSRMQDRSLAEWRSFLIAILSASTASRHQPGTDRENTISALRNRLKDLQGVPQSKTAGLLHDTLLIENKPKVV